MKTNELTHEAQELLEKIEQTAMSYGALLILPGLAAVESLLDQAEKGVENLSAITHGLLIQRLDDIANQPIEPKLVIHSWEDKNQDAYYLARCIEDFRALKKSWVKLVGEGKVFPE